MLHMLKLKSPENARLNVEETRSIEMIRMNNGGDGGCKVVKA